MIPVSLPDFAYNFDVIAINLDPEDLNVSIEIRNPIDLQEMVELTFRKVAHFSLSKDPEEDGGCYVIGKINLHRTNRFEHLSQKLGYKLVAPSFSDQLFYLSIEGNVCIDVVSEFCVVKHSTPD